jgi:hypothetical protein
MSTATLASALLAHQGGWDEVLLIGGPIVAIAGLLMLAKRRVERVGPPGDDQHPADVDAVEHEASSDPTTR